ncbi:MAG TPA: hypothetical protein VJP85_14650 [Candidatus Baltobacteraceae bacterium]|nr:hypothetical protein [Candidatus Baltobacteraceae bacterium]
MPLSEWVPTIVPVITLLVVAVTAYAALRQIRHLRAANETLALLELNKAANTHQYEESRRYVHGQLRKDIEDKALRQRYLQPLDGDRGPIGRAAPYSDFFEEVGGLVFTKAIDLDIVMRCFDFEYAWNDARRFVRLERERRGNDIRLYEMFEALAMTQRRYRERRGGSSFYPVGLPRDPETTKTGTPSSEP